MEDSKGSSKLSSRCTLNQQRMDDYGHVAAQIMRLQYAGFQDVDLDICGGLAAKKRLASTV